MLRAIVNPHNETVSPGGGGCSGYDAGSAAQCQARRQRPADYRPCVRLRSTAGFKGGGVSRAGRARRKGGRGDTARAWSIGERRLRRPVRYDHAQ